MAKRLVAGILAGCTLALAARADNPPVMVSVDAAAGRHAISPLIYGVAFAGTGDLTRLGATLNRMGGNNMSRYNWRINAQNLDADWYFESYPQKSAVAGQEADTLVAQSGAAGAQAMLTIPMVGWVAKLGPGRAILPSFSVAKYGAQCSSDPYFPDAGDGLKPDCSTPITGNDPKDADVPDSPAAEQGWVEHLVARWGGAAKGGPAYYLADNESSLWFSTHRDVHPVGPHAVEIRDKVIATAAMIKAVDPAAQVVGPEEWGWDGYLYSGYDQQYAAAHGWNGVFPDRQGVMGGADYIPWLLAQWKKQAVRPIDVLSVHFYPQGGEDSDDVSTATQLLRNRSTRQLWDPHYVSESWINAVVDLIPKLKGWVAADYHAGTPVALTEYNWGAEGAINGATAQADLLGLFGREGLFMATRWGVPAEGSPTYKAFQMYRNYDAHQGRFGDVAVRSAGPDPDDLAAFAAQRTADGALTVMVVNKVLANATPVTIDLANFTASGTAAVYQLTAANAIRHLAGVPWSAGRLKATLPAQSVTLFVLPE